MKLFAQLYRQLDAAKAIQDKAAALAACLSGALDADAAWIVAILLGSAPARVASPNELRAWGAKASGIPGWLVERCYAASGDLSETVAMLGELIPTFEESVAAVARGNQLASADAPLAWWLGEFLPRLREFGAVEKQAAVVEAWRVLDASERFVFNKLLSGQCRIRVGRNLAERALAEVSGLPRAVVSQRLDRSIGNTAEDYRLLINSSLMDTSENGGECTGLPYPFHTITPLCSKVPHESSPSVWHAEYLFDASLRVQLVRQAGCTAIWSSEHDNYTKQLPELAAIGGYLPDGTILEGTAISWNGRDDSPGAPYQLRQRLDSHTNSGVSSLKFIASDLLQLEGRDLRGCPFAERRRLLRGLADSFAGELTVEIAARLPLEDWDDLNALLDGCRPACASGVLLKLNSSLYGSEDELVSCLFVQAKPQEITAVLLYAEAARGQGESRFTNFTFGVWGAPGGERLLIPVGKTGDGLSDSDRRQVDQFVLKNTLERHGPVRVVRPTLVCRVAFDAVEESPRHKSGLMLRGARAVRLLPELPVEQADTLEQVRGLMHGQTSRDEGDENGE